MEVFRSKPLFIDSCALGLIFEPRLFKFWKRFENAGISRHFTSYVVYWEYLRGCGPRMNRRPNRDQFLHWATHNATVLPFGQKEANHASAIYRGLERKWKDLPKTDKREKLVKVHADIMIAATAVERGLQVLTEDIEDWADIWAVIKDNNIGPLGGFAVVDPKDIQV